VLARETADPDELDAYDVALATDKIVEIVDSDISTTEVRCDSYCE
jgi:hypothetical protein